MQLTVDAAAFIDSFTDPILILQQDGVIVAANRAARRWFGPGQDLRLHMLVEDENAAALIGRGLRSSTPIVGRVAFRATGPVTVAVNRAPMPGRGATAMAMLRIDQAKRLAAQFISLSRRMQEADRHLAAARNERDLLKERAAHLHRLARTDALTGLCNARAFREDAAKLLVAAADERREAALIYIDVDAFKSVNDSFGHEAGDAVLSVLAHELGAHCGETDLAGRLGGDEFALLLDLGVGTYRLTQVVEAIEACTQVPVRWRDALSDCVNDIRVSVSIGTAIAPASGTTLDVLMRAADQKMYDEKSARALRGYEPPDFGTALGA